MRFGTKGGTLVNLRGRIDGVAVPDLVVFRVTDWRENPEKILKKLRERFSDRTLIVRSSSFHEDADHCSNAGAFLSVSNVQGKNVKNAINRVIGSYKTPHPRDEVIVQHMVSDVEYSGVVFSHDPNNGSPYRIVNWSSGDDTSIVTSGKGGHVFYAAAGKKLSRGSQFYSIFLMLEKLMKLFDQIPLDCEFAVSKNGETRTLWLLQVRPLVITKELQSNEHQINSLTSIASWLKQAMGPHPFLLGKKTIYGVMPDWNPAEIIGLRPYPLALSLYREFVTDSIWAYQRHNYGYRNLRSFPLITSLNGLPYVDVRLSFNSFIPSSLEESIAEKLANHYLDKLKDQPYLHDKIEFEIVFSCFSLDLPRKLKRLQAAGFSRRERDKISTSLLKLTNRIIDSDTGLWKLDVEKLGKLEERREKILSSKMRPLEKIYWLIEDGKRYGTLPFAGLARAAFIAVQMIKSCVALGIMSENDEEKFNSCLSTVNKQLTIDKNKLGKGAFLEKYGHLRPGTYDILSARYDEAPELYFDWTPDNQIQISNEFSLSDKQVSLLDQHLSDNGLCVNANQLLKFCKEVIELREFAKFEFTKNLSAVLQLIELVGKEYGFEKQDLKYSDIKCFYKSKFQPTDVFFELQSSIEEGKRVHSNALQVSLPSLITEPDDVWSFHLPESVPNYVTQKKVSAEICTDQSKDKLEGRVVLIPNADPGFDWLFSHKIAGLITAWGGVNSHMAIRAGELGLPAVVGVGEKTFAELARAATISIDCATKSVNVLR